MAIKKGFWGMLTLALGFVAAGCSTPPPIRPALSQTVINIQRSSTKLDTGKLHIYVDDVLINKKEPLTKGRYFTYHLNNGVHHIRVVCGNLESETINFSANSTTLSFSATIENEPGLFGKKKLLLNRSTVSDDTGNQTDQDIQESYVDVQ